MNQRPTSPYDFLSRAFHWVTAIGVTIAFILGPGGFGRLMRDGIDPATHSDIVWHESLGILVFVLTELRLIWVAFRPAAPQVQMASWMQLMAKLVHVALWMLLLALGSEAYPLTLLGGVRVDQLPAIANSSISKLADWGDVHQFLGDAIMGSVALTGSWKNQAEFFEHALRFCRIKGH